MSSSHRKIGPQHVVVTWLILMVALVIVGLIVTLTLNKQRSSATGGNVEKAELRSVSLGAVRHIVTSGSMSSVWVQTDTASVFVLSPCLVFRGKECWLVVSGNDVRFTQHLSSPFGSMTPVGFLGSRGSGALDLAFSSKL